MKTKSFFDMSQAERYLRGSIIRWKSEPYTIVGVSRGATKGSYNIEIRPLGSSNSVKLVPIDDADIDMNPVPLGYINIDFLPIAVADRAFRYPAREWKVGLTNNTLKLLTLAKEDPPVSRSHVINSLGLRNTIMGQYPKYTEALNKANSSETISIAFGRKFALRKDRLHHLLHQSPIGRYKLDNGEVTLDKPFEFLKESLDRAMQA